VLKPSYTNRFEKELVLAQKRGKDLAKLKAVVNLILTETPLPPKLRDHVLLGKYIGLRECHIEPDWLLIYKLTPGEALFERTGTHSDLF
jgi:mRNA interferase YafQ